MRVIGAGLGRTGTNSLKIALEQLLNGPCYHMFELFQRPQDVGVWHAATKGEKADLRALMTGWTATVDWPAAPLFDKLADEFPDAKVLLSVRDPVEWYRSANRTIFEVGRQRDGSPNPLGDLVDDQFRQWLTSDVDDEDETIAGFIRYNERVRRIIPPERLIEWHTGDGWDPICAGLDIPVPERPFPHSNSTEDFQAVVAAARQGKVERGFEQG